ncbi:hypothetical protein MUK42_09558 [Musa troglodytarum]|uniref:Uncharacterized protein n=1 Tax=Musa troglodytarum TaxID=320322 RepID=A0A9E7EG69_9LILI|nr:hypothetical protein MUK42_09558 [Musa troglodytarum]
MKRGRAEAGLPSSKIAAESPAKAQRRPKGSTPKAPAAAGRTRQAVKPDHARKGRGDDKGPAAAAAADLQQSSTALVAPTEEEVVGWVDGAAELGDWWWGLWGVEEDKLSGWFPFTSSAPMPGEESCPVDCSGKKLTTTSGSCNTFTKSRRRHPIDEEIVLLGLSSVHHHLRCSSLKHPLLLGNGMLL